MTDDSGGATEALEFWIETGTWRKEYFEQDSQVREDFERGKSPEEPEQSDWLQEHYDRIPPQEMHAFAHLHQLLARKKSSASLGRKQSQSNTQITSDQASQSGKSSQYNSPNYEVRLEKKGSFMYTSQLGITDMGRDLCRVLLENEQNFPQDTLFRDDLFNKTCNSIRGRNEAMVVRDITPLICPSAQVLRIYGAQHLSLLDEGIDEVWSSMIAYEGTLPKPDYSVGFGRYAFTEEQLDKLKPFVGESGFGTVIGCFMATTRIYFPFFTCEVKCGAAALDFADRQNAQNMSICLRALVVLFKYVKREKELDRQILAFSVSHNDRYVRIYGHYPEIEGDRTNFYRHLIRDFGFIEQDGKEKWATYQFVKNVYDHHSLRLHKLICSGIDDLPAGVNFDLSQTASSFQSTPQRSQQSDAESMLGGDNGHLSFLNSQGVTPTTSFTQAGEPASKKPRS